jgi:succinyl-CoA synthetase alpha subunit
MFVNALTQVIVQGITGRLGSFHTQRMLHYGTRIVAGVTPGKGGVDVCGVPVFNSVKDALRKHRAEWSVLFVPAPFAKSAACEALRAGLNIVIITEGVPVHDTLAILQEARRHKRLVIGPNCPGITVAGLCKLGIMPTEVFSSGRVAVVSRSGTLTHEIVDLLTRAGIGQSLVVGIGGDRVVGMDFVDILRVCEKDKETAAVVLIGEIGGVKEVRAADFIRRMKKPVVAYVAGVSAPPGKTMGHAGAIVYGDNESAVAKIRLLRKAGALVARMPHDVPRLVKKVL